MSDHEGNGKGGCLSILLAPLKLLLLPLKLSLLLIQALATHSLTLPLGDGVSIPLLVISRSVWLRALGPSSSHHQGESDVRAGTKGCQRSGAGPGDAHR